VKRVAALSLPLAVWLTTAARPAVADGFFLYWDGLANREGVVAVCVGDSAELWVSASLDAPRSAWIPAFGFELIATPDKGDVEILGPGADSPEGEPSEDLHFLYTSRVVGDDFSSLYVHMREEFDPSLTGTSSVPIVVKPCFDGLWRENRRTIEIRQTGDTVVATVVDGSYSCYEGASAKGERDFEADIVGDGSRLVAHEGTGLKVCNPADCVEKGLAKTDHRSFRAQLFPDGRYLDVEWDNQHYDDPGEEQPCVKGEVEKVKESWRRLKPPAERPAGTSPPAPEDLPETGSS